MPDAGVPGGDHQGRVEGLVQAAIDRYPEHIALDVSGQLVTYAQLGAYSDQVAGLIRRASPVRPRRIGLIGDRSVVSYAAYLAILRLGATVVPLSPAFPGDRIRSIAQLADLDLLLTGASSHRPPGDRSDPVVPSVDLPDADALPEGDGPAASIIASAQPTAYVLFTSGSTGQPKGVPISHENALSFLTYNIARYSIQPGCRVSQAFDLSFDVSFYDIFTTWGSGATLVAPTPDDLLHPVRWVSEKQITHWASVPSVISVARGLRELPAGSMPGLRLSLFLGEQLTLEQAEAWRRAAPNSVIENVYGPTELTVAVTAYRLPSDPDQWPSTVNGTVPIGKIYDHMEGLTFDENGVLSGRGELCVRGPQRFGGYIDPRDNDGRFYAVRDGHATPIEPGGPVTGDHWYRTGDLVWLEPDGTLIHLGRLDDQVKVRGYRVELGEVENAIKSLAGIREAVVVATQGNLDDYHLTAFCVGEQISAEEIRQALGTRLPHYMIPRRIRFLAALPRTVSGKVNRRALAGRLRRSP